MNARAIVAITLASATLVCVACSGSSETSSPAATTDAGTSSGSTNGTSGATGTSGGTTDSNGTCTTLTQEGQKVDIIAAKKDAQPTPKGGTLTDGKYVLTGVKAFADLFAEGTVIRAFGAYTLNVAKGATTFEQVVTSDSDEVTKSSGDLVVKNTTEFNATSKCDQPVLDAGVTSISGTFTADPTSLKMYVVRDFGITAELTFTKK